MITGIHHVGLASADPAATARALAVAAGPAEQDGGTLWVRGPRLAVAIEQAPAELPARAVHEQGLTHLCMQSRDGERLRASLVEAGVQFHADPIGLGTGYLYSYGRLPGGTVLETESADHLPEEPQPWFGHVAFATADLERLTGFYSQLLGLPVQNGRRVADFAAADVVTGLDGVDVRPAWISGLNVGLEFWEYAHPKTEAVGARAGLTHVAFSTTDRAAAEARAAELGCADLRDPDGNRFQFVEKVPPQ